MSEDADVTGTDEIGESNSEDLPESEETSSSWFQRLNPFGEDETDANQSSTEIPDTSGEWDETDHFGSDPEEEPTDTATKENNIIGREQAEPDEEGRADEEIPSVDDIDDELSDLAEEAVKQGLDDDTIVDLFEDHGVSESQTKMILHAVREDNGPTSSSDSGAEKGTDHPPVSDELRSLAKQGVEKGLSKEELIDLFSSHGIGEEQTLTVLQEVGFEDDEEEKSGDDESQEETRDAVDLQREAGFAPEEEESEQDDSFMEDVDKSKKSLQVGRIYLTGRQPSLGKMRVEGLDDILHGSEDESEEERGGFIELDDDDTALDEEDEDSGYDPDENMERHVEERKAQHQAIEEATQ